MKAPLVVVSALAALALGGKCSPECSPEETRCSGSRVQVCNADGYWQRVMDCAEVEGGSEPWQCCRGGDVAERVHTCLPVSACREVEK